MTPQCKNCRHSQNETPHEDGGNEESPTAVECLYLSNPNAPLPGWLKDTINEIKYFSCSVDFDEAEQSCKSRFSRYAPRCPAHVPREVRRDD